MLLATPSRTLRARSRDEARALLREVTTPRPTGATPGSGWIASLSYDLGGVLEPAAASPRPLDPAWPLAEFARVGGAYLHDRRTGWRVVGDPSALPTPEQLAAAAPGGFDAGPLVSNLGLQGYTARVERAKAYIRAGDIYQANIAHRLRAPFAGSARALFAALASADPWHGVYTEADEGGHRRGVCSASPELFIAYDPAHRRLTTRPMKGTRPLGADPDDLRGAEKDRAELNMIVDLMRNDLGRVASFGSVRVEHPRTIEAHTGTVLQATATVSATLREGLTLADAIEAAFPPGSVTGAPKIRAMQVIGELEPDARGPYCGVAGWLGDDGRAELNVAIRTALLRGEPGPGGAGDIARGTLDFSTGAGIVADSDPHAEWEETLVKAEVLRRAIARAGGGVTAART